MTYIPTFDLNKGQVYDKFCVNLNYFRLRLYKYIYIWNQNGT